MEKYHDITSCFLISALLQESEEELDIILAQTGADQHKLTESQHGGVLDPVTGVELGRRADVFEEGSKPS